MIEVNRMTHKLLSEYLHLDPFDNILHEANQSVSGMGRITGHVIWELNYDFLPNFNYNNSTERFVKSEMLFSEENKLKREKAPKTEYILSYGSKEVSYQ
jgi:cytoplasmic FMR1 interacting protein